MSEIPYLIIVIRSIPKPNAKPEYSLESIPLISRTFLFTTPAPKISIQPVPLQRLQPFPWHLQHVTSTSTLGSVNVK